MNEALPLSHKRSADWRWTAAIALLVCVAVGLRLALASRYAGFYSDQRLFVQWLETIRQYGLGASYASDGNINYPPLFLMLMDGYGRLLELFGIVPQAGAFSFKALLVFIDLCAILSAVILTSRMESRLWRLIVLALFAFNPAFIADGAVWGQVDMLHGMLMALAVAFVPKRPWLSGGLTALAVLAKFQAVTVLPVIGIYLLVLLLRERRWQPLVQWAAGLAVPLLITFAYFSKEGTLHLMLKMAYTDAVGQYATVSLNAMNIWFYVVGVKPTTGDTDLIAGIITYRAAGLLAFAAIVAFVCVYIAKASGRSGDAGATQALLFKAAAVVNLAFFLLSTEMHERYSLPALLFVILAVIADRRWLAASLGLTATVFTNVLVVLRKNGGSQGFGGSRGGGRFGGGFAPQAGASGGASPNGLNGFAGRAGFGSRGGRGFGQGMESALSASYAWVAALNMALLVLLLWLLWRDMRRPSAAKTLESASSPSQ